jgi:hypothetical protein
MGVKGIGSTLWLIVLFSVTFSSATCDGADRAVSAQTVVDETARNYIRKLESRIADLESLVRTLTEGKTGTPPKSPQSESLKPAVKKTGDDEWGEPVVEQDTVKGRDEDARRRLAELETWKKKQEAKTAKEAEESADKVKFDFSGKYKLRFNTKNNLNLDNPLQYWQFDDHAYFDQRFQLKIDAEYGPLSTVLVLDKGNFVFDWKEGSQGTLDRWGEFQTVNSALVRELYAQYTGNFVVKAGRHSLIVGNEGVVFEGPADAIKLTYPLGKTPIGRVSATAAYIAVAGGWRNYNNFTYPAGDRSAVLGMANKLDGYLLSFDIKPKKDLTIEPYLLKVFDRGKFGDPDLNLDKDFNATTTARDGSFEPLWTGIAISGKNGAFTYKGDFVYLSGTYAKDRDFKAYAALLRGDYAFRKDFSLGLEAGRGSGNSAEEKVAGTGDVNDFAGLFLCKERRKFGNIFSQDLRAGYFFADSSLANVTFARAIADFEPIKKLKTNISLSKLWTTESVYKGRGPVGDWSRGTSLSTDQTRDIGWELDANLNFPIYKRLRGFVETGYFVPGDVYRLPDGRKADPASEVVLGAEFEF